MTIEEIDKKGFTVKFIKRAKLPGREAYHIALLAKKEKLFITWKPAGHKEYTTPFCIDKMM